MPMAQLLLSLLLSLLSLATTSAALSCSEALSCAACVVADPSCSWCPDAAFSGHRCAPAEVLLANGCPSLSVVTPQASVVAVRNATPVDEPTRLVQLYPQALSLTLRPRQPQTVRFAFTKAGNLPVDLYILSDLSFTMSKVIATVAKAATAIADSMSQVTRRFRMGFGTFVDKPVIPFANLKDKTLCRSISDDLSIKCQDAFGYHHNLNLTSNISVFSDVLRSVVPSVNLDSPEGGMDAVLQAAVCPSVVGWDPSARRLILFLTNGGLHLGGDGILAGLVRSPDLRCHMGRRRPGGPVEYLRSADVDYPPLSQVIQVLEERAIGVIFGVTENVFPLYRNLVGVLSSASLAKLELESEFPESGIVRLIMETYDHISSAVTLIGDSKDVEGLKVKLQTRCPSDLQWRDTNRCDKVSVGQTIEYQLEIEATDCLAGPRTLSLQVAGSNESVQVNVSTLCSCPDCDAAFVERESAWCGGASGDFVCGSCRCRPGWLGVRCECRTDASLDKDCSHEGVGVECSGRGVCSCGKCSCFRKHFRGKSCECDLEVCPLSADNYAVCGGAARGVCNCNRTCTCHPGYKGKACDCLMDEKGSCQNPTTGAICSGHGDCDCGVCSCQFQWEGRYCEVESDGEQNNNALVCLTPGLRDCVVCHQRYTPHNRSNANEQCAQICNKIETMSVNVVVKDHVHDDNFCLMDDEKNCRLFVSYAWDKKIAIMRGLNVFVKRSCEAPQMASVSPIVIGVILGILVVGIIVTAIWKVVAYLEDKQEYRLLLEEQKYFMNALIENPLYVPPETSVINPLHVPDDKKMHSF